MRKLRITILTLLMVISTVFLAGCGKNVDTGIDDKIWNKIPDDRKFTFRVDGYEGEPGFQVSGIVGTKSALRRFYKGQSNAWLKVQRVRSLYEDEVYKKIPVIVFVHSYDNSDVFAAHDIKFYQGDEYWIVMGNEAIGPKNQPFDHPSVKLEPNSTIYGLIPMSIEIDLNKKWKVCYKPVTSEKKYCDVVKGS